MTTLIEIIISALLCFKLAFIKESSIGSKDILQHVTGVLCLTGWRKCLTHWLCFRFPLSDTPSPWSLWSSCLTTYSLTLFSWSLFSTCTCTCHFQLYLNTPWWFSVPVPEGSPLFSSEAPSGLWWSRACCWVKHDIVLVRMVLSVFWGPLSVETHFCLSCYRGRYSFIHRLQERSAIHWTCPHLRMMKRSDFWNNPGGMLD